jgi:hypothetical protein
MFIRIAASLVICVGLISVANETLARGGGGFGGVRIAAPPAALRAAPFAAIRSHAFRSPFFRHRRSSDGGGSGLWDSGSGGEIIPATGIIIPITIPQAMEVHPTGRRSRIPTGSRLILQGQIIRLPAVLRLHRT